MSTGSAAAALGPPPAEEEPDLSDLLWDSNDLLSLSDLLDDGDAAWPPAEGLPFLPFEQHDEERREDGPLVCCLSSDRMSTVATCRSLPLHLYALPSGCVATSAVAAYGSRDRNLLQGVSASFACRRESHRMLPACRQNLQR